jgi:hypothetical protein
MGPSGLTLCGQGFRIFGACVAKSGLCLSKLEMVHAPADDDRRRGDVLILRGNERGAGDREKRVKGDMTGSARTR